MNQLGELIGADVELDLKVSEASALLERIASMLARRGGLVVRDVLASLRAREELGSTALGHGVAIPHARMPQCAGAAGVFVRTRTGIDFGAPDGRPVSLFLGLIVPKAANERHLKLLATAASIFSDRSMRENLRMSTSPIAVSELLATWPEAPATPCV